jgi:hypothetical protein
MMVMDSTEKEERIIYKDYRFVITNKNFIFGMDNITTVPLKKIKRIDLMNFQEIKITLDNGEHTIQIKRGSGVDQVASILLGGPYEAGSWQEDNAAFSAYLSSLLTMAVFFFGEPEKHVPFESRKAWCRQCNDYVELPETRIPVWKVPCPICGSKGMTSKKP